MPELYGIETLKKSVHLAIALPVDGVAAVKSKFSLFNVLGFIGDIQDLITLFKSKDMLGLELKDLHPIERTELLGYIKTEFQIPDKDAESFVKNALTWVNTTIALFEQAKALKK